MRNAARIAAVDLGASSGRVFAVDVDDDRLRLTECSRFDNQPVRLGPLLYWDLLALHRGMIDGLRSATREHTLASVGVDSWAVDYGLLDSGGALLGNPVSYRDPRTDASYRDLIDRLGAGELFRRTGIAVQRFNTIYQLADDARRGRLEPARRALLLPDLLSYFLSGVEVAEITNASTTQLLGLGERWDAELVTLTGADPTLLAPLVPAGTLLGPLRGDVGTDIGNDNRVTVIATASHDTAAAVCAVPAASDNFAYLSCGTWSLIGLELDRPIVTDDARRAGFTNERGIDGTTRFLRNVMGLWLLQQCLRTWNETTGGVELARVLAEAEHVEPLLSVIDLDAGEFFAPGNMPDRIAAACSEHGQHVPSTHAEFARAVLDSLAVAYGRALEDARTFTGQPIDVLHVVGGGVRNRLLCQLVADSCAVSVIAGPVEAAALGNALVQARALGIAGDTRGDLRRLVSQHVALDHYEPRPAMTARYAEATAGIAGRDQPNGGN